MVNNDFNVWWSDVKLRHPSVPTWIDKHYAAESRQVELLKTWRGVLADVPLADALEVNRQMQSGDMPWVGEYDSDKERLPRHVRQLARQLVADRRPPESREPFAPATRKSGGFPGAKLLRRLWELRDEGVPHDEARAIALREFPVGQSPFREPRYACLTCLDSGRVLVASNAAIEAELIGRFADCHHRDAVMKCTCRGHEPVNPKRPLAVYDAKLDFRIEDPLWRPAETQRFQEWVAWQRTHRAAEIVKGHINYDPSLAEFNQRTF